MQVGYAYRIEFHWHLFKNINVLPSEEKNKWLSEYLILRRCTCCPAQLYGLLKKGIDKNSADPVVVLLSTTTVLCMVTPVGWPPSAGGLRGPFPVSNCFLPVVTYDNIWDCYKTICLLQYLFQNCQWDFQFYHSLSCILCVRQYFIRFFITNV